MYDSPEALRRAAWQIMARGVADRRHPARTPTLATVGPDGPQARSVVLRGWQDGAAELHTDAASAKVSELRADPRAALHVWVPKSKIQVRLTGTVSVTLADAERWAEVPEAARAVYGGDPAPGQAVSSPEAFEAAPALDRFAVLILTATSADILHIGDELHRRAVFIQRGDVWQGAWIAP